MALAAVVVVGLIAFVLSQGGDEPAGAGTMPAWAQPYLGAQLGACDARRWNNLLDATWREHTGEEFGALGVRDGCTRDQFVAIWDRFYERGKIDAIHESLMTEVTPLPPGDLEAVLQIDAVLVDIEKSLVGMAKDRNYEPGEILFLCARRDAWTADLEAGLAAGLRHEGDHGEAGAREALEMLRGFDDACS